MLRMIEGNKTTSYYSLTDGYSWIKEAISGEAHKHEFQLHPMTQAFGIIRSKDGSKSVFIPTNKNALQFMVSSSLTCYVLGRHLLSLIGLDFEINTDGSRRFSGHNLMSKSKPDRMPGVNFPEDYRVLKAIKLTNAAALDVGSKLDILLASLFYQIKTSYQGEGDVKLVEKIFDKKSIDVATALIDMCETGIPKKTKNEEGEFTFGEEVEDEEAANIASQFNKVRVKFRKVWADFETFNASCNAVGSSIASDSESHKTSRIDITGQGGCRRFVPLKEWFSDKIKDTVTTEKVFSLLPAAELSIFEMWLGRTVSGRVGQVYSNGSVSNRSWRGLPIWVSKQAGTGKSAIAAYLKNTLSMLGYTNGSLPADLGASFGWADVAKSDWGYEDDCDDAGLSRLVSSGLIKSLVSNTKISAHKKGKDHENIENPICTLLMICNSLPVHMMSLDSGALDRILPMSIYSREDTECIEKMERLDIPFQMNQVVEKLAKDCGTTVEVIIAYAIRLCLDKWLAFKDDNEVEAYMDETRKSFKINLASDHHKGLMQYYLYVANRANMRVEGFEMETFMRTIWFSLNNNFSTNENYPWVAEIPECASTNGQINILLSNVLSSKVNMKSKFKEFMEGLSSKSGFNYKTYPNHWVSLFEECKGQVAEFMIGNGEDEAKHEDYYVKLRLESAKKQGFMVEESNIPRKPSILFQSPRNVEYEIKTFTR